jgi:Cu-processing system permease protein
MNPRKVLAVAIDVLREAVFSRYLIVLFSIITLGLVSLAFSLDLEVVDGAIAAGKLFGGNLTNMMGGKPMMASEALRPFFEVMGYMSFVFGISFMVLAVADIAPKMFAPGRVELMLSLPVRRVEIVIGTYLGVLFIAGAALTFAIGGASAVLFVKAEVFTVAPLAGALAAFVGFMTIYAAMLMVSTLARSAALSAATAFMLFIAGMATSDRAALLALIKTGITRDLVGLVIGPLPRLLALATSGASVAKGVPINWGELLPAVGGSLALAGFCLGLACAAVQYKDY